MRSTYNWNEEHDVGIQPIDLTTSVTNKLFKVENNRLQLSLLVAWRFNNINAFFEKIVGVRQRTVTVYSDVVESSVVGSGKFPLLHEVQYREQAMDEVRWNPYITNRLKFEGINGISLKWRLPPSHPTSRQNCRDHWTQTAIKTPHTPG